MCRSPDWKRVADGFSKMIPERVLACDLSLAAFRANKKNKEIRKDLYRKIQGLTILERDCRHAFQFAGMSAAKRVKHLAPLLRASQEGTAALGESEER